MNRPPKTKFIALASAVLLALSATTSYAAGLGKLSVSSALGQPLSAEIEIVSLQPGEFEALTVRSASPEAYNEAKVEYSPLLRQLNFAVAKRADGKPILRITSNAPINEPFVDVLVEVTWPAGRLVREYPILLDPPGFDAARVAPPVSRPAPALAPAPVITSSVITSQPVISSPAPQPYVESRVISSDSYGPVKAGDTLASIAAQFKPESVSLDQMLVALYRENEGAFIGKNMNRLRTGQILRVPSEGEVLGIERAEAQKVIKVQVADWKAYRDQVAGSAANVPVASANAASGKIATAKPTLPAPTAGSTDTLKIAKSEAAGGKAGGAGAKGGAQEQLNALREEAISKENQLKEANSRVKDLESQIDKMTKLAKLKGDGVPAADAKVAAKMADKATPAKAVDAPKVDAKALEIAKASDLAKAAAAEAANSAAAADAAKKAALKTADTTKAGGAAKIEDTAKKDAPPVPADAVKVAEAPKAPAASPIAKPKAPPPPEPGFLEEYGLMAAGGVGVLGVGGLLAFIAKRKKKADAKSKGKASASELSSIMPSDLKPNTVTGASKGGLVDTGNSSFLTDFDKTGPGAIDTDEVDPVAEAEVYIAYGRDTQAEEILKEAMSRDKGRHEIPMKLLEIYHARKSAPAFETVAKALKESAGGDSAIWAKAAAMGSSIDPTNSLYGGSAAALAATGKFTAGAAGVGAIAAAAAVSAAPPDLDFDLGFSDAPASAAMPAPVDLSAPVTGQGAAPIEMDFNLDTGSATGAPAATASENLTTDAAPGGALDFDLAFEPSGTMPVTPAAKAAAATALAAPTFDFDLSALSLDPPADNAKSTAAMFDTSDKTMALKVTAPAASAPVSAEMSTAVTTKLELAKAYVEIGDSEGAKEILLEVAREGNAAQQAEAKGILAGI